MAHIALIIGLSVAKYYPGYWHILGGAIAGDGTQHHCRQTALHRAGGIQYHAEDSSIQGLLVERPSWTENIRCRRLTAAGTGVGIIFQRCELLDG